MISIHALLAESDEPTATRDDKHSIFLSTLSLRRATEQAPYIVWQTQISIHALLAESDIVTVGLLMFSLYFYPRSPCGERPYQQGEEQANQSISIHALLAESDGLSYFYIIKVTDISIHALLAESDPINVMSVSAAQISIHALLAESDVRPMEVPQYHILISIHALLAESDGLSYFYIIKIT